MSGHNRYFILNEAVDRLPLVRRILPDLNRCRQAVAKFQRLDERVDLTWSERAYVRMQLANWSLRAEDCQSELDELGVVVSPDGSEAWFPFEHRWIGRDADGRIRTAFFVFKPSSPTISEWIFDGWPRDRRPIPDPWWNIRRPVFAAEKALTAA